jgi:hypothetical protein
MLQTQPPPKNPSLTHLDLGSVIRCFPLLSQEASFNNEAFFVLIILLHIISLYLTKHTNLLMKKIILFLFISPSILFSQSSN